MWTSSMRHWPTAREIDDKALLIRALVARGCVALYDPDAAGRTSLRRPSSRAT